MFLELIPPEAPPKRFLVGVRFEGNFKTNLKKQPGEKPAPFHPGEAIRFNLSNYRYLPGSGGGPSLEGDIAVMVEAYTPSHAVELGIEKIEGLEGMYEGFLHNADRYEISVTCDADGKLLY